MRHTLLRRRPLIAGCAAAALCLTPVLATPALAAGTDGPKNVIVLISDGAGFNQFDSTNFYKTGHGAYQVVTAEDGTVSLDPANTTGAESYMQSDWSQVALSHYSQTTIDKGYTYVDTNAWGAFDWVTNAPTDSAAAGTAMSTGSKTYNGILGYDASGQKLTTAGEVAMASGRKLGLVTSVPFNHATPAAFIAHNSDRNDYQGIATEMLFSGADVIMGGGHPGYTDDHTERDANYTWIDPGDYSSLIGGKTPFSFIEDRADFEALASADSAATQAECRADIGTQPVFGLAQVAETLQERRAGGTAADVELGVTPLNDVPSLETMTEGALNQLSTDSNGFFLMVEGGAIDWAGHSNFTNHLIEEQTDFNDAVQSVVDWVETSSSWDETLVIVTADHETGYLAGVDANPDWTPMAGEQDRLPEVTWHSGNHTNALVPLFAKGAGADQLVAAADETDSVRGAYLDNTEMGTIMKSLMADNAVSDATGALTDPCAAIIDPTPEPSQEPTAEPTQEPTAGPSTDPRPEPSEQPSAEPTQAQATTTATDGSAVVSVSGTGSQTGGNGVAAAAPSSPTGSLARTGASAVVLLGAAAAAATGLGALALRRARRD